MNEAQDWGATEEEYVAAKTAVEQALSSAGHLLSESEAVLLHDDLLAYLLGSPAGRFALRQTLERVAPERSGDVSKEGGDSLLAGAPGRKTGGGQK